MLYIQIIIVVFLELATLNALDIPNPKTIFVAKMDDTEFKFEYKIINNTTQNENIDSVSGGCSCLSVICNKKILIPGEEAIVKGSYDFKTDVGKQRKLIYIKTSSAPIDSKSASVLNEYKLVLEGEIPSPLIINKSALIWIDGDKIDEKKFTVTKKNDFTVESISVERDTNGGGGENFQISKVDNLDQSLLEFSILPKTTELASVSSNLRDYFCRLNINYIVIVDGKKISRTERLDLLLAKKPGKIYDINNSKPK